MTEPGEHAEPIKLAAEDIGKHYLADARSAKQIDTVIGVVHERLDTAEGVLERLAEIINEVRQLLTAEKEVDDKLTAQTGAHEQLASNLVEIAEELLAGSNNNHAHDALKNLQAANKMASSSADASRNVHQKTEGALEAAVMIHENVGALALAIAIVRSHTEAASAWGTHVVVDAQSAASHTENAVSDLVAYQGDL